MSRLVDILENDRALLSPYGMDGQEAAITAFIARNGSYTAYEKYGIKALQTIATQSPQVASIIQQIQDQLSLMPDGVDAGRDRGVQKSFATLDAWL